MKRKWINQPSTQQTWHELHGTNVLAEHEHGDTWRVYWLHGDVISSQMLGSALSDGWVDHPDLLQVVKDFLEIGREGGDTSWHSEDVQGVFYAMMRAVKHHKIL